MQTLLFLVVVALVAWGLIGFCVDFWYNRNRQFDCHTFDPYSSIGASDGSCHASHGVGDLASCDVGTGIDFGCDFHL